MNTALIAFVLFALGIYGVITRRDLLRVLISVMFMIGAITLLLVSLAYKDPVMAYSIVLLLWAVEVIEIVIALAAFLYLSKNKTEALRDLRELRW